MSQPLNRRDPAVITIIILIFIFLAIALSGCEPAGYPTEPRIRCESEKRAVFAQHSQGLRIQPSDSLLRQDLWRIGSKTLLFHDDCSVSDVVFTRPTP